MSRLRLKKSFVELQSLGLVLVAYLVVTIPLNAIHVNIIDGEFHMKDEWH